MTNFVTNPDKLIDTANILREHNFVSPGTKLSLKLAVDTVTTGREDTEAYLDRLKAAQEDLLQALAGDMTNTSASRVHKFQDERYGNVTGVHAIVTFNNALAQIRHVIGEARKEITDHQAVLRRYVDQQTHR